MYKKYIYSYAMRPITRPSLNYETSRKNCKIMQKGTISKNQFCMNETICEIAIALIGQLVEG